MDKHDREARKYKILISPDPDGEGFIAHVPAIPGVCACEDNPVDALLTAYDGIASILDSIERHGDTSQEMN